MKWKIVGVAMSWVTCGMILILAGSLHAQMQNIIDLTGRDDLTPEEIVQAVLPLTRGLRPTFSPFAVTVRFAFDSAEILPAASQNLHSLGIVFQRELAPYRIRIEGHTDSIGSEQYNQKLSERRATSVKQYLVKNFGISSDRLISVGKGKREPMADNDTPAGRFKNRRAQFAPLETE